MAYQVIVLPSAETDLEDLAGLCRLRIGDHRILYWVYPQRGALKVYRIQHRREVYRNL